MMNHSSYSQPSTHASEVGHEMRRGIRERLAAHPALTVGIAVGVGALLGVALSSRDKNLLANVAHLVARLALMSTKSAGI